MNNDNPPNENTGGNSIRNYWKSKTKLEQRLVIFLTIVALLLIGLILFIIIIHAVAPNVCKTAACITAASQIVSHIDPSVDPCEDFFKFACGNFLTNAHGDLKASSIAQLKTQMDRQLAEILQEPIKENDNPWMKSEKALFKACMNESAVDEESLHIFEKHMEELQGWPVVVGYQWREELFDWRNMVFKLREKGYPHWWMLDVRIIRTPDPGNKNRYIPTIALPHIEPVEDNNKELYMNYMTEVAISFGAETNRARTEMEKVFNFMEALRKIKDYNDKDLHSEPETEVNETAFIMRGRLRIRDYQEMSGEIDWLDYINTILYPVGRMNSEDYVIFPKLKCSEDFFHLLYRTTKRTLANYMIWRVVEKVMPYMPKTIKHRLKLYICLHDKPPTDQPRFKFCKNAIEFRNSVRPLNVIYARKFLPQRNRNKVKEIVAGIKSEFISVLERVTWMDKETKERALDKARNIVEVVGAPGDYFNDAIFKQVLSDNYTNIDNDSFFEMMLLHSKLQLNWLYFRIHMNVNETRLDQFYSYSSQIDAFYSFSENVVMLPVAILQGVFYNPDRPSYLNYGAIGSVIGHELTHGFSETGGTYNKEGQGRAMWTTATHEAYKKKIECLVDEADAFLTEDLERQVNGTATLEENLADFTGLKVAYAVYKKLVSQNGKEPQLPEINYTPNQLFWISAVSYECFKDTSYTLKEQVHAHSSFRVVSPLRNNEDFAKDFNCPVGSKMNPSEKCQVF